jgi:hypothetical protein
MTRRRAAFTQAEITRAARAAQKAGLVVELRPDGAIRLVKPDSEREQEQIRFDTRPPQPLC